MCLSTNGKRGLHLYHRATGHLQCIGYAASVSVPTRLTLHGPRQHAPAWGAPVLLEPPHAPLPLALQVGRRVDSLVVTMEDGRGEAHGARREAPALVCITLVEFGACTRRARPRRVSSSYRSARAASQSV